MTARQRSILLLTLLLMAGSRAMPHPTGNMIAVGEQVYWSYIHPVGDPAHKACIMSWKNGSEPEVVFQSEYPASDFMLHNRGDQVYILERRYLAHRDKFETRLLKMIPGETPEEIWPWFPDRWRIGEAGFVMLSDTRMVFGRYPGISILEKGRAPVSYFDFPHAVRRIRGISSDQLLLLGETTCWLTDSRGQILQSWDSLLDPVAPGAPLERNQVFDADYRDGALLLAYWGKRQFKLVYANGKQHVIRQLQEPQAPHWVAFLGTEKLLFSSSLVFTGETPKPNLVRATEGRRIHPVWQHPD